MKECVSVYKKLVQEAPIQNITGGAENIPYK